MAYLVKITGFYPKDYCYQCMFHQIDGYGDSNCMLHDLDTIYAPNYEKPEWCPFNSAEEVND